MEFRRQKISGFVFLLLAVMLGMQPCWGALKVGDAAPALKVGKWLQGDAVKEFEGDKVYIVEFWATWCGPCKASIPHINEIHERLKDKGLVVIGQNVWENDDTAVEPFVKSMADKMTYRVASDDKSDGGKGKMAESWLIAAEQNGIPCAFIVNKQGRIVSIGHPMSIKEELLDSLLAEPSTKPQAVAPVRPRDTATAPSAKAQELARRAATEIRAGEWDKAETSVTELQENLTENFRSIGGLLNLDLLLGRKQNEDALQLAKLLCEDFKDNPAVRVAVATRLVRQVAPAAALQAAAGKIATPVSATAGDAQADALATLARIAFQQGDHPRAVEIQTKAVAVAPKKDVARQQAVLDAYQNNRLPAAE